MELDGLESLQLAKAGLDHHAQCLYLHVLGLIALTVVVGIMGADMENTDKQSSSCEQPA